MNLKTLLFTAVLLASGFAQAATCPVVADDPFSVPTVMPTGIYKGKCVDTNIYRPSLELTAQQRAQYGINDQNVEAMANFNHDKKFWIAVVPKERLSNVVFQMVELLKDKPIYHGQVRFVLTKGGRPVRLIEQTRSANPKVIELKEDIVFSLFGVRALGHEGVFNPFKGLAGFYASSYIFGSLSQEADWSLESKQLMRQYNVNLDPKTSFSVALKLATEKKITEGYNTFSNSCLDAILLINALSKGLKPPGYIARVRQSFRPLASLKRLGLIHSQTYDYDEEVFYKKQGKLQ